MKNKNWTIPDIGMEFIWIQSLNCWAGKYQVTNCEYRKFIQSHDSLEYENSSLNGENQPVVFVNFDDAQAYAKWLTKKEKKAGRLPVGYKYRLPTQEEWTAIAQCGDDREYPWGNNWPPVQGEAGNYDFPCIVKGNKNNYPVTCDVKQSGANIWDIYGVGGNVWELTQKSSKDDSFDAWRGASWYSFDGYELGCLYRNDSISSGRSDEDGFRLFLSQ